jgi:hypothetical protein
MAVHIISNLTKCDAENRFEKIFSQYYDLLSDSIIVAGHLAAKSGKIARSKLNLQSEITERLLNIDGTKQKHKDLLKAGAIEAFSEYFEEADDKEKILGFVKEQLNSKSPKTRKKAREFMSRARAN